jgi:hypothetical protein
VYNRRQFLEFAFYEFTQYVPPARSHYWGVRPEDAIDMTAVPQLPFDVERPQRKPQADDDPAVPEHDKFSLLALEVL